MIDNSRERISDEKDGLPAVTINKGGPCLEEADRRRRQKKEDMCTVSEKNCLPAEALNFEYGRKNHFRRI